MATATAELAQFGDGGITKGATVSVVYDTASLVIQSVQWTVVGGTLTVFFTDGGSKTLTKSATTSGSQAVPANTYNMYTMTTNWKGDPTFDLSSSTWRYQLTFQ